MPTLSVPAKMAKAGVRITTNHFTQIQVRMASIELLVGGPYPKHVYGHTALRVTALEMDKVFDYGRYGKSWGFAKSEGEGILNIWNDFNTYIRAENSLGRDTTGFVYARSEESVTKVFEYYENIIPLAAKHDSTAEKDIFHIDTYYALGPNCTTLSVAAAKSILPDIDREWSKYQHGRGLGIMEKAAVSSKGWPAFLFMPADLQAMLEGPNARKASRVNKYGGKR